MKLITSKFMLDRSREAAEVAASVGIKVAYEFHQNTFTETLGGALALMDAVDCPNIYSYWQPPHGSDLMQRLKEIETLKERLLWIHVFHWGMAEKPPYPRLGLDQGVELWKPCLDAVARLPGDRFALLEFVCDDSVEQFQEDAKTLLQLLT